MSYLIAGPELLEAAAADVARIGSSVGAANATAATRTTEVLAAAGDEVSAAMASLFSRRAQEYQALSAQAAAFQAQFRPGVERAGARMRPPRPPC